MPTVHKLKFLLAGLMLIAGCRQEVKERKYSAVTGVASDIDLETGKVSMDWQSKKTGESRKFTGRATQTTEIFINGVSAKLEDVRRGDRVCVIVYPSPDDPADWIVTSVRIEREESFILNPPPPDASPTIEQPGGAE